MANERAPVTAAPPPGLGARPRDGSPDPELAREMFSTIETDPEAAIAAMGNVSADVTPPEMAPPPPPPPPDLVIPEEMLNPDDDGRLQQEIDARRTESQRQAMVRKDAVTKHIAEIDADANHPLKGMNGRSRLPFGSRAQRLSAPRREGFHRHWFNDTPDRIDRALRAGYKMVNDVDGKPMKRVVGVGANNDALHGFYMEIPVEWYVADIRASRQRADDLEMTIRKGKLGAVERQYTPQSGIEFEHEAGGSYQPRA